MSELEDLAREQREFAGEVNAHLTKTVENVKTISTWVAKTGPVIEGHTAALEQVGNRFVEDTKTLVELRSDVNDLLEEMPRQPKHPPVDWRVLTAEQAATTWVELGEWVDSQLVEIYSADRAHLPDCWALHPAAVRHLSWLWTSYLHAYLKGAGPNPAAEWHTRWHRDALDGLQAAVVRDAVSRRKAKCSLGTHFGEPLPGAATPQPHVPGHLQPQVPAGHVPGGGHPRPPQPGQWVPTPPRGYAPGPAQGQQWAPVPPPVVPNLPVTPLPMAGEAEDAPAAALAAREFWWPHLLTARAADVAKRKEVERIAAEEEAAREAAEQEAKAVRASKKKTPRITGETIPDPPEPSEE